MIEWLNTRDLYIDYCHLSEMAPSALKLLQQYGSFSDEIYDYWQPKNMKGQLLPLVKRRPIWMTNKRMPAEKFHMKIDAKKIGQQKLAPQKT